MNKLMVLAPVYFLLFVLFQLVPFACGTDQLTFSLHAEELPSNEAWKEEFTEISSKAVISMTLPTEELQVLVERCDKLQPIIESLEESPRKVYLKRLNKTKSLFVFVIESRKEHPKR